MPKKVIFLKFYKDCVSLCSIIRVKSFPSGWSGQKEDICPSIKKSIYYVQEGTVVRVDPGFVHPLTSCWDHSLLAYNKTQLNGHWLREKIFYQNTFYILLKFQFFESHSVFFSDFRKDDKSWKKFIDHLHLTFWQQRSIL